MATEFESSLAEELYHQLPDDEFGSGDMWCGLYEEEGVILYEEDGYVSVITPESGETLIGLWLDIQDDVGVWSEKLLEGWYTYDVLADR